MQHKCTHACLASKLIVCALRMRTLPYSPLFQYLICFEWYTGRWVQADVDDIIKELETQEKVSASKLSSGIGKLLSHCFSYRSTS